VEIPVQKWLEGFPWSAVEQLHECGAAVKTEPTAPRPGTHTRARALWEAWRFHPMELRRALMLCREACQLAPFAGDNAATFTRVAIAVAAPVEAALEAEFQPVWRGYVARFVAGTLSPAELDAVLATFSRFPAATK
jgi:hypothetical protein